MNVNPDLQPLFTPGQDITHPNESILTPLFSLLSTTNKTIAPWIEPTFWSNMLNKECYTYYFQYLFKDLVNNAQSLTSSENLYSYITTIFHLVFSYHNGFPKDIILPYYDRLIGLKNQDISLMLIYLEKHSTSLDFSNIISRFNLDDINILPGRSIPIFTLYSLFHQLRASLDNRNDFLSSMIDDVLAQTNLKNSQILLHLINVVVSFFEMEMSKLILLKESLNKFYYFDSTVSEISADIIHLLDKTIKYPLYGFHKVLNQMSQISEAFGCQIPVFFGAKQSNVATYLYNDTINRSLYMNAYFSYPRYFIHRYFNLQPPAKMNELQRFMFNLKFSKKYLKTVPQAFNLTPADPRYIRPVLTPPVHQYQFYRLVTDFQMTPEVNTPYNQQSSLISSPVEAILNQSFFTPISNYFKTLDPKSIYGGTEQQLLVIGSDFLLSTVVTTISLWLLKNPQFNFIEFQIYFVPIGDSQIGEFISEKDILYKLFVRNLYRSVSSIMPTFNETSEAFFPRFVQTDGFIGKYENNLWFSDPSPSHIFQFGIQHYLIFAQNKTDIYIWRCQLVMADSNKVVSVPFMISVIVDTNDQKRCFDMSIIDCGKNEVQNEVIETKIMSVYNANRDKRANPNKDFLILETTSLRMISSVTIATQKSKPAPFFVEIDGRKYGPVTEIRISCFSMDGGKDPAKPEPLRMKVKTFLDIV